jgi:hypothetical protein
MATRTYRIFISSKISPRHSNIIIHDMLKDLGFSNPDGGVSDQTPIVRNMHRGIDESYFDVDFPSIDDNIDYTSMVESIKRYVGESSVQYQDITTEPPKDM